MTKPDQLEREALQQCAATVRHGSLAGVQQVAGGQCLKQEPDTSPSPPPCSNGGRARHGTALLHSQRTKPNKFFKTEALQSPCSMGIDFCLGGFESPSGYESSSPLDLSPPGSSHYDSASAYSDLHDFESSSMDQGYDTPSIEPADSPAYFHPHLSPSSLTDQHAHDMDQYNSISQDLVEAAYRDSSSSSPVFQIACPNDVQESLSLEAQGGLQEPGLLQPMDTHHLLDPTDCHLLVDPVERHLLLAQPGRHLLDTTEDLGHPFDFSVLDYDTEDLSATLPCYTCL